MAGKVRPIKPDEVGGEKERILPDSVLESFNELIVQNYTNGSAIVRQDDVVILMVKKGLDRGEIFDKGWLDVEDIYWSVGWLVSYDKPGYNENYPATFTFKCRSKRNK